MHKTREGALWLKLLAFNQIRGSLVYGKKRMADSASYMTIQNDMTRTCRDLPFSLR
jgi:hypothetical protein